VGAGGDVRPCSRRSSERAIGWDALSLLACSLDAAKTRRTGNHGCLVPLARIADVEPATDRQPKHQNAPARDVTAAVNLHGTEPWEVCHFRRVDTIIVPNNTAAAVCLLVEVVLEFVSVITGISEDFSVHIPE